MPGGEARGSSHCIPGGARMLETELAAAPSKAKPAACPSRLPPNVVCRGLGHDVQLEESPLTTCDLGGILFCPEAWVPPG